VHTSFPVSGGGVGSTYVHRGDPATFDFDDADLVEDNAIHTLDISAIVPLEAVAVDLSVRYVRSTSTVRVVFFFHPDQLNTFNALVCYSVQTSAVYYAHGLVAIKDGLLGYKSANNTAGACEITICGWFL